MIVVLALNAAVPFGTAAFSCCPWEKDNLVILLGTGVEFLGYLVVL